MRALYRAEDYLDELAYVTASPIYRQLLVRLGWLLGKAGDLLASTVR